MVFQEWYGILLFKLSTYLVKCYTYMLYLYVPTRCAKYRYVLISIWIWNVQENVKAVLMDKKYKNMNSRPTTQMYPDLQTKQGFIWKKIEVMS